MHLVGFITRIYHDARSSERQTSPCAETYRRHVLYKLMHSAPIGIRPFLPGPPSAHIGTLRHGCWAHNYVGSAYCIVPDASKLSSYPQLPKEEVRPQYRLTYV